MSDSGGGCCKCCFNFIFTLGLTALFMWLSLRTSSPDCLLSKFYLPLDQTSNSSNPTSLEFELRLKNTNKDKGVYYDPINVTFYTPNKSHVIGNFTITKFYQGHQKNARKNGTIPIIDRDVVSRAAPPANGSTAPFRVDLVTSVRYKILMFKTKRHTIRVGANVDVNGTLIKVNHKDIKLKSNAHKIRSYCGQMGFFFANLLVLDNLLLVGKNIGYPEMVAASISEQSIQVYGLRRPFYSGNVELKSPFSFTKTKCYHCLFTKLLDAQFRQSFGSPILSILFH
ncbi:hypothetical protein POTOM_039999 [Populus tomentosa]|uniref:Late embryogenesis abundant protein LEA-2 subgroup domain-containing protein n=1 Tax=Populus tomentosa TaxID=118781 RepID=A0A8X7YPE3_POPTO|nr:hypothetical protein POTOM_039999 [Populus tomentosa]